MKKKRKRTLKKTKVPSQRDYTTITKPKDKRLLDRSADDLNRRRRKGILGDRRRWTPANQMDVWLSTGMIAGVQARDAARPTRRSPVRDREKDRKRFKRPQDTTVCKRRSERRRTLFAIRRAGKGTPGPRKKKYTDISQIRCK